MKKLSTILTLALLCSPRVDAQIGNSVFQLDSMLTIRMYFPYPAWMDTLEDNYTSRREVPATFICLGDTLDSVGVRYKGNSSYGLASGTKKSFKLDFDEFVSGQRLDQLEILNLNNSFKDPTLMREVLMYDYLNEHGASAGRAAYANVYVNDEYRGVYVTVEEVDTDEFLNDHYGESGGNLYKGDPNGTLQWLGTDTNQYRTRYEKHSNEEEDDWSDLIRLCDEINNTPIGDLPDSLAPLFDIPELMRFISVNTLMVNLDSYQGTGHNHFIYHRDDERFQMLPWDLNEAFGNFNFGMSATTIKNLDVFYLNSPPNRPLLNRLYQTQIMKDLLLHHLWNYLRGPWSPAAMNVKIDALYALIQPSVYADTCKQFTTAQFETNINSDIPANPPGTAIIGLRSFVTARTTAVNTQVTAQLGTRSLLINEVLALNNSTNADEAGDFDDWVELVNLSGTEIDLAGYSLSDDFNLPSRFEFPAVSIPAGGFLIVWCDGEPGEGPLHTSFTLDAGGEVVYLFNPDGSRMLDHVIFSTPVADVSYARHPTARYPWSLVVPSPGAANSDNLPPVISAVTRLPLQPVADSPVTVSARIIDTDGAISLATLVYDFGSGFQNLTMWDDGAHGDSAAGDGRFGAFIPGQPSLTTVYYYLDAQDNEGAPVSYPAGAPFNVQNYVVDRPVPQLLLNEFMAQNNSTIQDEEGAWEDWVELYNLGGDTLRLEGFALTDNFNNMQKWVFPDTVITPGGHLLIWCDEDGGDPGLHASFKLSAGGERLALSDDLAYGGIVLDSLSFGAQTADVSFARSCDGGLPWALDATSTPGTTNGQCLPGELTLAVSGEDLILRWQPLPDASSYNVYRMLGADDTIADGEIVAVVAAPSAVLAGEAGLQFKAYYVVTAIRP